MHPLAQWRRDAEPTLKATADQPGVSVTTFHRLEKVDRLPNRDVMARIFRMTCDKVRAGDFFPEAA